MVKPSLSPLAAKLHAAFETSYGRMFAAGLLAYDMVPDLVRGLAFTHLAAQDDSIDARKVLTALESAVDELTTHLTA